MELKDGLWREILSLATAMGSWVRSLVGLSPGELIDRR